MATQKQTAANRANARSSTGPRSHAGKAIVRQNSFKHGLSKSSFSTAAMLDRRASSLESAIVAEGVDEGQRHLATEISVAESDLEKVRRMKVALLNDAIVGGKGELQEVISDIRRLDRYEQNARVRRKRAVRQLV